jgi:hypothetical protein
MYLAVVAAITGQALAMGRPVLRGYAAAVWITVASLVRWYDEPALARQFDVAVRGIPSRRSGLEASNPATEVGLVTRQWPRRSRGGAP